MLYVRRLIAPGVNTMPMKTLRAFADHGIVNPPLDADPSAAERVLSAAAEAGLDLAEITDALESEGVRSFCGSYDELLRSIDSKLPALAG